VDESLLYVGSEAVMTLRDMTPDELEMFEEEIVQGAERRERDPSAPASEEPMGEVTPDDDDGLPDGPAKYRVPS
jgi:hypothetical protein